MVNGINNNIFHNPYVNYSQDYNKAVVWIKLVLVIFFYQVGTIDTSLVIQMGLVLTTHSANSNKNSNTVVFKILYQ